MADDRVQFKLLLPADLKERLEDAAHSERRSVSAEIISRLEASFSPAVTSGSFAMPTDLSPQQIEHVRLLLDAIKFIKSGYPDEKPPAKRRPSIIGPYRKIDVGD